MHFISKRNFISSDESMKAFCVSGVKDLVNSYFFSLIKMEMFTYTRVDLFKKKY